MNGERAELLAFVKRTVDEYLLSRGWVEDRDPAWPWAYRPSGWTERQPVAVASVSGAFLMHSDEPIARQSQDRLLSLYAEASR